ncbi:MAG TPA: erythromycin esterase family protein [Gammaproteobacteria bacterium]|nr:erythromycin esterase family protein [Gammaproteobacteria bacterium]
MTGAFRNRREAGRRLAAHLTAYANRPDVLVLALPRGGVPVAFEVARALKAPLDVFLVRKLGVPGYEELAMGAIATGGVRVLNEEVVKGLDIPDYLIDAVAAKEQEELRRRERLYRGSRPLPDIRGRTVILVDDGLATGATMLAAVKALRQQQPARIVVAVPTAAADTCEKLRAEADEVICAITPTPFYGVGRWYEDFSQTTDQEVRDLLAPRQPREERETTPSAPTTFTEAVCGAAHKLRGNARDYDPLMARIGDAHFALLGEASHGTHEFYRERAEITKRLIQEKGFVAVAVEADWPDAFRVDRYVRGMSDDVDAKEALADFRRFPTWMWRNTVVLEFVEWLRAHNDALPAGAAKVGFYGLDLYSLHASMKAVLQYLEKVDPEAARRARERYSCFDRFGPEPQVYGLIAGTDASKSCQEEVIKQLVELQRRRADRARRDGDGHDDPDELFNAEQNARVAKNAEAYYRSMFLEEESSWNLRDRHMVETLEALMAHLGRQGGRTKIALWAHNSHLGDARATDMSRRGELNVGQLVREKYSNDAVLVGFTTYHGTVTAASDWGAVAERKRVRPGLPASYEAMFHAAQPNRFLLTWRDGDRVIEVLRGPRLERAIGVIYRPETERISHYFGARLTDQFDAVLHFDETRAVEPLEYTAEWETGEVPETFPFAV